MKRALKAAAALLSLLVSASFAHAQLSSIATNHGVYMGGVLVSVGTVSFTPVNAQGTAIAFAQGGGGLNGPTAFSCTITAGVISGTCQIPDSALTTPANILYYVLITNTTTQKSFGFIVAGITGSTWALDSYGPPAQTTNIQQVQSAYGSTVPSSCVTPSYFTQSTTSNFYQCVAGVFVQVTGTGGSVTYGTTAGTAAQGNDSRITGALAKASAPVGLVAFGDSISAYTGATNLSLGFLSLERNQIGGHIYDGYILSGDQLLDMNKWQHQAGSPFIGGPNTQIEIGTNDVTNYGSSANLQTVFQRVFHESLLWGAIPSSYKVFAQTCTKTTGFGTADNVYLYGLGQSSTTQNDVLTCSVTTGPNGDIAIGYMIYNGGAGTFTVKVNGTLQADPLTASTTWLAYGDGSSTITTSHGQTQGVAGAVLTGFPANTAATVTFTVTSATSGTNVVEPVWVGSFPASSTANPYVIVISPNHQNNANDALSGTYAGFISSLVTADTADGLNEIYVDTRDALGTSYATYYSDTLHPNNAGHALMASTIISALPTALVTNSPPNLFEGIFNVYQRNASPPANPMNFPVVNPYRIGDGVNVWSPGITLGGGGGGAAWIAQDPVHGAYIAAWNGAIISLCTGSSSNFYSFPATPSALGTCGFRLTSQNVVDLSGAAYVKVAALASTLGGAWPSGATISPNNTTFLHVTGTSAISTITPPISSGCINIIPDGAFTTTTTGNIAVASTAVVGKILTECYDGTKWYPSY